MSCKRHAIDVQAYLTDVFRRIRTATPAELESLLPDRWIAGPPGSPAQAACPGIARRRGPQTPPTPPAAAPGRSPAASGSPLSSRCPTFSASRPTRLPRHRQPIPLRQMQRSQIDRMSRAGRRPSPPQSVHPGLRVARRGPRALQARPGAGSTRRRNGHAQTGSRSGLMSWNSSGISRR